MVSKPPSFKKNQISFFQTSHFERIREYWLSGSTSLSRKLHTHLYSHLIFIRLYKNLRFARLSFHYVKFFNSKLPEGLNWRSILYSPVRVSRICVHGTNLFQLLLGNCLNCGVRGPRTLYANRVQDTH